MTLVHSFSHFALFGLALFSLLSPSTASIGSSVQFADRHAHWSHRSSTPTTRDLIQSRQAVASAPAFYTTSRRERHMRETIERFKRLTYEFDETRDEMGRLSHRAHKIEKRDTDATGQEIHDLMFNLVQVIRSTDPMTRSRQLDFEPEVVARRPTGKTAPSASPVPSSRARSKRSLTSSSTTLTEGNVATAFSRAVTPLLSIISLASSTMPTLSSSPQRAAVEALIAEARDEIEILLAEMRRDVPYTTTERDLLAFQ